MKKAVIIGATSGIGRELALLLGQQGYKVGITGRRNELLEELVAIDPETFYSCAFDVCSHEATTKTEQLLSDMGGDVELAIFCSGTGNLNPDLDPSVEETTNKLNVVSFTNMMDFWYRYFAAMGRGHIVGITSVMGLRGSRGAPSYAASKAYQINYLEGLRNKSKAERNGVTVTDIRPGSVKTDMMKGEGHFWIATPMRAAEVIVRAIERKKSVQYVTPRWKVIGALLKIMPKWLIAKIL